MSTSYSGRSSTVTVVTVSASIAVPDIVISRALRSSFYPVNWINTFDIGTEFNSYFIVSSPFHLHTGNASLSLVSQWVPVSRLGLVFLSVQLHWSVYLSPQLELLITLPLCKLWQNISQLHIFYAVQKFNYLDISFRSFHTYSYGWIRLPPFTLITPDSASRTLLATLKESFTMFFGDFYSSF